MKTNATITGVILAGGKNSRMGSDKGMLSVFGKKTIERIISALQPVVDEIMIISNGENYNNLNLAVYPDLIKDCGPMGGIYTALHYSKTKKILVVSCDMPFIDTEVLRRITNHADEGEAVLPERDDLSIEPLCAIYSKACTEKFKTLLETGDWKLKEAIEHFNVKKIRFSENALHKKHFLNMNTPAEYQSIIQNDHEYSS